MNATELEKIEIKTDGENAERFRSILKTVVNVPKEEIRKREDKAKKKAKKS